MDLFGFGVGAFGIGFVLMLILFGLFFAAVVTFMVIAITKNAKKASELGHDPFTMETELTARAIDSQLLKPEQTLESRLAELDDLLARGVITPAEHATARADALAGR